MEATGRYRSEVALWAYEKLQEIPGTSSAPQPRRSWAEQTKLPGWGGERMMEQ